MLTSQKIGNRLTRETKGSRKLKKDTAQLPLFNEGSNRIKELDVKLSVMMVDPWSISPCTMSHGPVRLDQKLKSIMGFEGEGLHCLRPGKRIKGEIEFNHVKSKASLVVV
jgi:hypothetical protein